MTVRWTTLVKTQDGKVYELSQQRPPHHEHRQRGESLCKACLVVNAWTAPKGAP